MVACPSRPVTGIGPPRGATSNGGTLPSVNGDPIVADGHGAPRHDTIEYDTPEYDTAAEVAR
jgi:hypothetical protein